VSPAIKRKPTVYTQPMSWSFRALVFSIVLAWGLLPQVACFMPDHAVTPAEMDCCKGMSSDCSGANMAHACCQTVIRPIVGVAAKVLRTLEPPAIVAEPTVNTATALPQNSALEFLLIHSHAPPADPTISALILRI
jgi:hypothetical protein